MSARDCESALDREGLWQELVALADIGFFSCTLDGVILQLDPGLLRILDLEQTYPDPQSLVGTNLFSLFQEILPSSALGEELRAQGKTTAVGYPFQTLGGKKKWTAHHLCLCTVPGSDEVVVQGISQDITQLMLAEERLRESEEKYRALAEQSLQGLVIAKGKPPRLVFLNETLAKMLGYTVQELLALEPEQLPLLIHPEDREIFFDRYRRRLEGGGITPQYLVKALRKDQTTIWVEVSASRITYGGETAIQAGFMDVTERMKVEEERQRFQERIRQAQKLESLGLMAGGIAHDLNNMLLGIIGNAELALKGVPTTSSARARLMDLIETAHHAAEMSNEMLAYSGKGRLIIDKIEINEIVQEISSWLRATTSREIDLRYQLAEALPAIEADASQIRQVVLNLVSNAAESLAEAEGVVTISTGSMECSETALRDSFLTDEIQAGTYVYLEVSDTGCGMSEETREKIFDPFFTTKVAGRGLGLAAVLGIVRSHKGTIKVSSAPNKGATFRVLLPAVMGKVCSRAKIQREESPDWRGMGTVLLVDDEPITRQTTRLMLESFGLSVLAAGDGAQAVSLFSQHNQEIRLVLLDLTMPQMDGLSTLKELRQVREDVRVILMSGYNEQDLTSYLTPHGLADFIQKPFRMAMLRDKVRSVMEGIR